MSAAAAVAAPKPADTILAGDLGLAAFLIQNGLEMVRAGVRNRQWKIRLLNPNPEHLEAGESVARHLMAKWPSCELAIFHGRKEQIRDSASRTGDDLGRAGLREDGTYQVGDIGMAAWMAGHDGVEISEVLQRGQRFAVRFTNPNPEQIDAGVGVLRALQMRYPNTRQSDHDGKVRAIKKAAFGD